MVFLTRGAISVFAPSVFFGLSGGGEVLRTGAQRVWQKKLIVPGVTSRGGVCLVPSSEWYEYV